MLAGVIASAVESIGDYYACARLSGAPPPPTHAINRGIGTEGLGCILAGIMGTGNGTTSYSENIGAIGVTKVYNQRLHDLDSKLCHDYLFIFFQVGSRRVVQFGALIMIIVGCISKFGAFFLTIPQPIVGGVFCIMFGIITAVGLSNMQFVDLNSTRNLFVLGFSMFMALVIPTWVEAHPESINTGSEVADQILEVLLTTSMFIALTMGFILDNTIPGTLEERGVKAWRALSAGDSDEDQPVADLSCYDIPFITPYLKTLKFTQWIPCLPTFQSGDSTSKEIA